MELEFRLIYKGSLPAQGSGTGGSRVQVKHAIRRQLHSQLHEFWHGHQLLKRYAKCEYFDAEAGGDKKTTGLDLMSRKFTKGGYHFLPLVGGEFGIACSLDILFLRRDNPGNLIESGGDIDNRIKTLFDALKIPEYDNQVVGSPQAGEDPFFCLLEDDKLITDVKITTDRLLIPREGEEHIHDVHLVLHIKTKIVDINKGFSVFA
jgi:hypothetical protein